MSITTSNPFALLDLTPSVPPRKPRAQKSKTSTHTTTLPDASFAAAGNVPRDTRTELGRPRDNHPRAHPGRSHHNGRTFDRHSMTAHTDTPKTLLQGWGGADARRELLDERLGGEDARMQRQDGRAEQAAREPDAPPSAGAAAEQNTLTLDEYLSSRARKQPGLLHARHPVRTVSPPPPGARAVPTAEQAYFSPPRAQHRSHRTKKDHRPTIDTAFSFARPSPAGPARTVSL